MTSRMDAMFREADPVIASVLDSALAGKEISISDGSELYAATGISFHLTGMVADEIRRRKVGETVTYVVNRNINFTNVCIKQCGFCAFSRDFREEEGYMLPVQEIVRRAAEAHGLGATEVCIQAGLPPDMEPDTYESICRAIKEEIPDIHIHGFSPEEVLYGAQRSDTTIREYLARLKDAGVDTLPGTSAEILDPAAPRHHIPRSHNRQEVGGGDPDSPLAGHQNHLDHDVRSPGERPPAPTPHGAHPRHTEGDRWIHRVRPAQFHSRGGPHVPAPHPPHIRDGAGGADVLLTHAISRIMLHNIDNVQMSWVKEGSRISQLLLMWGANDFGGTLINESISTAAGARYGQLIRPAQIRRMVREIGRVPAERTTTYGIIRKFGDEEVPDPLDAADPAAFGSYAELIKIDRFRYANPRTGGGRPPTTSG